MAGVAPAEASPSLVERDAELRRLRALTAAAATGRGAAIVLEGPAGIGKTSLVAAASELAAELGLERLAARGGQLEQDFAYGVVRQLFEPRLMRARAVDRAALLHGAAGLAAPLLGLPTGLDSQRYTGALGDDPTAAAMHGLYWLTANLAAETPLLVAVDDLHWSDTASVRFIAYLARRVDELPLLLLAASRPPVEAHAPELIEALASDPVVRRLEPAPLSEAAVAELVRAQLGAEAADDFCRACHTTTGGNPFLVRSVLRAIVEARVEPSAEQARRLPEVGSRGLARSVARRLAGLGPEAHALARAVAVLGTNAELGRATVLAELDDAVGAAAADALMAAQVLAPGRPLEFVHPVVRSAVHDAIPPAELAARHAAAARLLHAHGSDAERVAPHLLASEPRRDAWAVGSCAMPRHDRSSAERPKPRFATSAAPWRNRPGRSCVPSCSLSWERRRFAPRSPTTRCSTYARRWLRRWILGGAPR